MKSFVEYDPTSGDILMSGSTSAEAFTAMLDGGRALAEGTGHPDTHYVLDGQIVERPVLPPDLAPLRDAATARIDAAAERERLRYITPGAGQAMVYKAKQEEALQFQQTGAVGLLMQAEIGITAPDATTLAQLWLAMQGQWLLAAAQIEAKRLTAKAAVQTAATPAAIEAAAQVDWAV